MYYNLGNMVQPVQLSDFEVMAPVGSWESLAAAFQAGADSIYFGIENLNMRSHSSANFTTSDLREIVRRCSERGVKSYLTVNTIMYDQDLELMRTIIDTAKEVGLTAIIASDVAAMQYANSIGVEVHLSTQLNISNAEALKFYSQFADVVVLARELDMEKVDRIHQVIVRDDVRGRGGKPIRIEMFCHGALCMAISGKCYLSLHDYNRSANRGSCMQVCRHAYTVTDQETGEQLTIDNKYVMSPKDLKTIHFIGKMMDAGVRVFKIEGRARSAEYVKTVVSCYKEAIKAHLDGTFSDEKVAEWDQRLSTVYNRGFWDGYYLGQRLGEWSHHYGSQATEKKIYIGRITNYFKKIGVVEALIETSYGLKCGEKILVTGETTGAYEQIISELRDNDGKAVDEVGKGELFSFKPDSQLRRNDKLYKIVSSDVEKNS